MSHEHTIAEKLVSEGRSSNKPLLYNQAEDDALPDFVLMDYASGEVPMEVFGQDDEDYLKRKADKTAYYDRQYGQGG